MLTLQGVAYAHPNKDILFDGLTLTINKHDKAALIGNNGTGKSTLLRLMAGELHPSAGIIKADTLPYYVPQVAGQFSHLTVAQALRIDGKLHALREILAGNMADEHLTALHDDWTIEERCREALAHWQLPDMALDQPMASLSGGQKTRVFLAGILIHQPGIVLLDEPSNHLDKDAREMLYRYIQSTRHTLVVVSHDRTLLNLLNTVYELTPKGITPYGGNYDFYTEQKNLEQEALQHDIKSQEKALRAARAKERESVEREQKLDARGKRKQEKAGLPTIMMNTLKNSAEKSTAKLKDVHAEKTESIAKELDQLRKTQPANDKMKMGFDNTQLHKGKVLVTAKDMNMQYGDMPLWPQGLTPQVRSGERICIQGPNGSGKTTLIRLLLGQLKPSSGSITLAHTHAVYIDQDYSLIDPALTVYRQVQQYNSGALQEHEVKTRLTRFLFTQVHWDKPCAALSGGEKMRLMLCCLTLGNQAPDMLVLDEPTNNLDIQNMEILTAAVNEYQGTLIVVSHDAYFLEQVNAERVITLPS